MYIYVEVSLKKRNLSLQIVGKFSQGANHLTCKTHRAHVSRIFSFSLTLKGVCTRLGRANLLRMLKDSLNSMATVRKIVHTSKGVQPIPGVYRYKYFMLINSKLIRDVSKTKTQKRRPKTLWSKTKTLWSKTKTHWSKTKTHWSKTKTHRSKTKTH